MNGTAGERQPGDPASQAAFCRNERRSVRDGGRAVGDYTTNRRNGHTRAPVQRRGTTSYAPNFLALRSRQVVAMAGSSLYSSVGTRKTGDGESIPRRRRVHNRTTAPVKHRRRTPRRKPESRSSHLPPKLDFDAASTTNHARPPSNHNPLRPQSSSRVVSLGAFRAREVNRSSAETGPQTCRRTARPAIVWDGARLSTGADGAARLRAAALSANLPSCSGVDARSGAGSAWNVDSRPGAESAPRMMAAMAAPESDDIRPEKMSVRLAGVPAFVRA